jgi:hypothetical protein
VKRPHVVLVAAAVLVAAVSASARISATRTSSSARAAIVSPFLPRPPYAGPRELVLYGHVRTLTRTGSRYVLRADPALWLGGVTASRAALEDTGSSDVPNDYYVRDESRRLLTFVVPARARVTVMTNKPPTGITATPVTVSELARLLRGEHPRQLRLFEPKAGFWIRVATDTVRSLDQQYQP